MLLASKAAWAGIVFILLTTGISAPRRTPLASRANVGKEVPGARLAGAPSSRDSIWIGKPAPSPYLHKQLDSETVHRTTGAATMNYA